jgi:hypothetical protein
MKMGFIVDGDSEYRTLPIILSRIAPQCANDFPYVVKAPIPPYAPFGTIAKSCQSRANLLFQKGAQRVVILIDRESREECCGQIAQGISSAITEMVTGDVLIVVKNRRWENWIISDPDALKAQPRRFGGNAAIKRAVVPDNADSLDALSLLKKHVKGPAYSKILDSRRTLERAVPMKMAANSRSFRRFLRCLGVPEYRDQSRSPVAS